eukprot:TRINITY_DN8225_c0_g1_i1.p1 TRINITY_DN8225_c0_g1~~TRINITY_DN8225_c0_g1_i1.p1  ORF type:complete len:509 (+),score=144.62 TRINITY_DN8225_c0_g1_i1:114-1640(+)
MPSLGSRLGRAARQFSNSCLDFADLYEDEDLDLLENLSPRSRGRRVVGGRYEPENAPPMPATPPGRGCTEQMKTFSGSCLELDDLTGRVSPTASLGSAHGSLDGFNGRGSPEQSGPARQIFEYVHLQNNRRKNRAVTILVIGAGEKGAGYLATHVIAKLLHEGHTVVATLRDMACADVLRAGTKSSSGAKLEVVPAADLISPSGDLTVLETSLMQHQIASVVYCPSAVNPVDGIRNLFTAIENVNGPRTRKVKRVVMTSNVVALHDDAQDGALGEKAWNNSVHEKDDPFTWARVEAEREGWRLSRRLGVEFVSIVTATPVGRSACGEVPESMRLLRDLSGSSRCFPYAPRISRNLVDVQDVAHVHYLAVTQPAAAGQRYVAAGKNYALSELGRIIRKKFPVLTPPTNDAWDWLTLLVVPILNRNVPRAALRQQLRAPKTYDTKKVTEDLGMTLRCPDQSILDSVEELLQRGDLVPDERLRGARACSFMRCAIPVTALSITAFLFHRSM